MLRFYCFICILFFPLSSLASLENVSFSRVQQRAQQLVDNAIKKEVTNADPKLKHYLRSVSAWLQNGFYARFKRPSGKDYEVCGDDKTASFVERNHRREIFFCQRSSGFHIDTLAQILIHEVVHKVQYRMNRFRTHVDECWAELVSGISAKDSGLEPWQNGYSQYCNNIYSERNRGEEKEQS